MFGIYLYCLVLAATGPPAAIQDDAAERAIKYLSRVVPAWSRDNHCFSCHNNGDGARALYVARGLSFTVPDVALGDTTEWLRKPDGWDKDKGKAGFSDERLARIEFGNSLVAAV